MFTTAEELADLCTEAWQRDARAALLVSFAQSDYRLGDLGLNEADELQDWGFLEELFQGHGAIYEVLGGSRQDFQDGFPLLQVIAAAHPRTPPEVLERLSLHQDPEVLWAAAGNPSATPELHTLIVNSRAQLPAVLQELPNPQVDESTPNGIRYGVSDMWEISNVYVGVSMVGNRNAHPEVIEWAVAFEHPDMNKALLLRNSDRLSLEQWERLLQAGLPRDEFNGGWIQWMAMSEHLPEALYVPILERAYEGSLLARRVASRHQ